MPTPDPAPIRRGKRKHVWWENPPALPRSRTLGPGPDPAPIRHTGAEDDLLVTISHEGKTYQTPLSSLTHAAQREQYEDEVAVSYKGVQKYVPRDDLKLVKTRTKRLRRPKADPAIAALLAAITQGSPPPPLGPLPDFGGSQGLAPPNPDPNIGRFLPRY